MKVLKKLSVRKQRIIFKDPDSNLYYLVSGIDTDACYYELMKRVGEDVYPKMSNQLVAHKETTTEVLYTPCPVIDIVSKERVA